MGRQIEVISKLMLGENPDAAAVQGRFIGSHEVIVRCADCIHAREHGGALICSWWNPLGMGNSVKSDGHCHNGRRKGE